jgi:hypothetical protein
MRFITALRADSLGGKANMLKDTLGILRDKSNRKICHRKRSSEEKGKLTARCHGKKKG